MTTFSVWKVDATSLLKKGLTLLSNTPFETLDVNMGARTQDIRKAYKKLALKYHPDKNPRTTPLFQVIHAACEKLTDKEQRMKEETKSVARSRQQAASQQQGQGPPPFPRAPAPPTFERRSEGYYNPQSGYSNGDERNSNPPNGGPGGMSKEQMRKADSDRRAKEFAAKFASEQEAARRKEMEAAQRAKYQEDIRAEREEMLRKAQQEYFRYKKQTFEPQPVPEAVLKPAGPAEPNRPANNRFPNAPTGRVPPPSNSSKGQAANPQPQRQNGPLKVPVPFGFKCVSVGATVVELEWQTSSNHPHNLAVELNWKNRAIDLRVWESASKLINGGKCRKKNLVAGSVYEFRLGILPLTYLQYYLIALQ